MDTFMLRLGAHYGPTVVSTEVQEQNLTWVQTGLFLPIKPFKFHCHSKKEGMFQLEFNPVQNSS